MLTFDVIYHILDFLSVEDHIRFTWTCSKYYKHFRIVTERHEEVKENKLFSNNDIVLRGYGDENGVTRVLRLEAGNYEGPTTSVKDLIIRPRCRFINGDTIKYTPISLTGVGLKYLVKLDIDRVSGFMISNIRFERLVTLRASGCNITDCKFDALEDLDIQWSRFSSEMPVTIKTLNIYRCCFTDECIKKDLLNHVNITDTARNFIQYVLKVKIMTRSNFIMKYKV